MTLGFRQRVNANDALRTGAYSKTLTFTLSTTHAVTRARPRSSGERGRQPLTAPPVSPATRWRSANA